VVWLGENLMNVARYAGDAREQALPLVGGEIHDWNWLLGRAGLLAHEDAIAAGIHALGVLVVVAGVLVAVAAALPERSESGSHPVF
jgi:hypothetical protein